MKRCARCKQEKPLVAFYADRSQKDGKDRRCIDCAKEHLAALKEKRGDEMRARRRERHRERYENDPEFRERQRKQNRERQRRRRKERPEENRAAVHRRYEKTRNDPERWAAFLAKKRAYIAKLKTDDPERYEALLEARRIMNRLRRIEKGLPVRESKAVKAAVGSHVTTVASAPLSPIVANYEKRYRDEHGPSVKGGGHSAPALKTLAETTGLSVKLIGEVRDGRRKNIALDSADKLCVALGYTFSLVYQEDQ